MKLLKVIKNPITDHLPVGCKKVAMSYSATRVSPAKDLVPKTEDPIVIVIGAMAHGAVSIFMAIKPIDKEDIVTRGIEKWFGAHFNQQVRFSSAAKCKKDPRN